MTLSRRRDAAQDSHRRGASSHPPRQIRLAAECRAPRDRIARILGRKLACTPELHQPEPGQAADFAALDLSPPVKPDASHSVQALRFLHADRSAAPSIAASKQLPILAPTATFRCAAPIQTQIDRSSPRFVHPGSRTPPEIAEGTIRGTTPVVGSCPRRETSHECAHGLPNSPRSGPWYVERHRRPTERVP